MEPEDGVKSSVSLTNEKKSNEITVESPVISRNEKSTAGNCNDGRNESELIHAVLMHACI